MNRIDEAILEFILQMIDEVERVVIIKGSAEESLNHFDSKNSILFNLLQIGEKLQKIESPEIRQILPVKEAYSIRNRITHDYDGIDLVIVEDIIIVELPKLKETVLKMLS